VAQGLDLALDLDGQLAGRRDDESLVGPVLEEPVIRKAAVLPVPVWDCTAASAPSRVTARVRFWTSVVSVYPRSAMACRRRGSRFNSSKRIIHPCGVIST
jgi:hypothetical protein